MKKKIIVMTFLGVFYLSSICGQYDSMLSIEPKSLRLQINVRNDYCFACPIPFTLELVANRNVEAFDLNTGYLNFKLYRNEKQYSFPNYYSTAATGGWFRNTTYLTADSTYETILEKLEQKKIKLKANIPVSKELDMITLFKIYPDPGEYTLQIEYEGQIRSSQKLRITIDYENSMKNILNLLENSQNYDGFSTLSMFYYLTGYKSWNDSIMYKYDIHFKEAPRLKIWWQNHKDLILKIESTLKSKQYHNLKYSDSIPKLIQSLKNQDYQERILAYNTLSQILLVHIEKPSNQDTDLKINNTAEEMQRWWNENKELINWINRVIFESRL